MVFMHEEKYINSKYRKTNIVIVVLDKHLGYYRHTISNGNGKISLLIGKSMYNIVSLICILRV